MPKAAWKPPPDPNFMALASGGFHAWEQDKPEILAFDTETSGVEFYDQPFCVTAAWLNADGQTVSAYFELGIPIIDACVKRVLNETPVLIGHNLKFDLQKTILRKLLDRPSLASKMLHDTEALAHLDDEHRKKGLKDLAVDLLGYDDIIEVEIKSGPNKGQMRLVPREKYELDAIRRKLKIKKEDGYHLLPRATILPYALKDAEFTLELYYLLRPDVEQYDDLWSLYEQEMTLSLVLLDLEANGMGVISPYVSEKIKEYQSRVLQHELDIEGITGMEVGKAKTHFNPNSPDQVKTYFSEQGLELESTDEEHLSDVEHPLAAKLLELRGDMKILNTYFRALRKGTRDGVFHPSIRQHGTVTGRTSSGGAKGDA